ncbi:MAG: hypothetical protein J0H14_15350 [Alphaproteobacteria bacterium]|nr:hypothetical protein [Alphaproteobacteria bacterium]
MSGQNALVVTAGDGAACGTLTGLLGARRVGRDALRGWADRDGRAAVDFLGICGQASGMAALRKLS